jgi:hypothetical protein
VYTGRLAYFLYLENENRKVDFRFPARRRDQFWRSFLAVQFGLRGIYSFQFYFID